MSVSKKSREKGTNDMQALQSRLVELEQCVPYGNPALELEELYKSHGFLVEDIFSDVCRQYAVKTRKDVGKFLIHMQTDLRHDRASKYLTQEMRKSMKRQQDRKASLKKRLVWRAEKISLTYKIVLISEIVGHLFNITDDSENWIKPTLKERIVFSQVSE